MARPRIISDSDSLSSAIRWENIRHSYFSQMIHTQDKARDSKTRAEGYFRQLKASYEDQ